MSTHHRLVRRAYALVEAGVPMESAIEDLVTVAQGSSTSLEAARDRAAETMRDDVREFDDVLELAGFDVELNHMTESRNSDIRELLERALRAVA